MSYSAYVMCNCYQNGKTVDPPYKENVVFDEDGLWLEFPDDPENTEADWNLQFEKEQKFEEWKNTACPHAEMEVASEFLCNSMGMSGFKKFLWENGGEEKFPVLLKELPRANGGCMNVDQAKIALVELHQILTENVELTKIVLENKNTGEIKMIGDYDMEIPFAFFDFNRMFLLNKEGFFILEKEDDQENEIYRILFQSKDFREVVQNEDSVLFIDNKKQKRYRNCKMSLSHENVEGSVNDYIVEKRIYNSNYWNFIIEPLITLCRASVETGNPVHWC